jgi:hypothetical protein
MMHNALTGLLIPSNRPVFGETKMQAQSKAVKTTTTTTKPVFTTECMAATRDYAKAREGAENKIVKLADVYAAHHITHKDVAVGGDTEIREQVLKGLALGFPMDQQRLLSAETKSLGKEDKEAKRKARMKLGKYISAVEAYLLRAERAENGTPEQHDKEGDSKGEKTEAQRIQKMLDNVITKLQKLEAPAFDISKAVSCIKAIKALIPAV